MGRGGSWPNYQQSPGMRITLVFVGRTDAGHVAEGLEHYLTRLRRSAPVDVVIVPEGRQRDTASRVKDEAGRIVDALQRATANLSTRVVVLDEQGKSLSSTAFAKQLGAWRDQGARQLVFVVGGAFGLDDEVRKQAALVLSLSAMTFTHQLVRAILAEQIYRAFTILEGKPYHH